MPRPARIWAALFGWDVKFYFGCTPGVRFGAQKGIQTPIPILRGCSFSDTPTYLVFPQGGKWKNGAQEVRRSVKKHRADPEKMREPVCFWSTELFQAFVGNRRTRLLSLKARPAKTLEFEQGPIQKRVLHLRLPPRWQADQRCLRLSNWP